MNAERLHAIVIALKDEISHTHIAGNMQQLVSSLQNLVNQPQQPSYQQSLASSRDALYAALANVPSDKLSPAWRQILTEIGGEGFFGNNLKESIESSLGRNQMTPAVALQELKELAQKLTEFHTALDQAASALRKFNIGDEKLAPGQCEIGVLLPRVAVKSQLLEFAKELNELGRILNTFSEVATGKTDELEIRTISSSDFLVHIQSILPFAACLSLAVERIVSLYKQLLEIRKLRQEIHKQGVSDNETKGIEEHANRLMETGIEKAAHEIVTQFYKGDKERKNELLIAMRQSMNKIANRIDQGFNLEVRVEPVKKQDGKPKDEEREKAIAAIQSAAPFMQFLKLEGKPLLRLPEGQELAEGKEKQSKKKKVRRRIQPSPNP